MERQRLVEGGPLLHQGNQRRISNQFVAVDYILKLCMYTPFKSLGSKCIFLFSKETLQFIKSNRKEICMVTVGLYFK